MMMKSKYSFDFNIETRSSAAGEIPTYIVNGYATIPEHAYAYKYFNNNVSLKEMFTEKGAKNLVKKLKSKNVFVDALHERAFEHNTKALLKQIQKKSGVDISEESNKIMEQLRVSDIPIAKIHSINLDGNKPYIETRLNPLYREVDEEHKKYFDAIWYSLQNGYLNKFSINFKPTDVETVLVNGEMMPKINDVDVYGISYTQDAANEMADITEVAVRSVMDASSEVNRMEEETKKENKELKEKLASMEKKEQDKIEANKKAKEEESKKKLDEEKKTVETTKEEIAKQKAELEKQKEELDTKLKESETKKQETSVVPPEDQFNKEKGTPAGQAVKDVISLLPEVNIPKSGSRIQKYGFYQSSSTRPNLDGKIGFGELLIAQAGTNSVSLYDSDTKRFMGKKASDIVVSKQK